MSIPRGCAIVILGASGADTGRRARELLPGARLFAPSAEPVDADEIYERLGPLLVELFAAGRPIIGVCASGILIRALAPLLVDKRAEPPLVALAENGSVAVPLLGGHHGANALACALAAGLGGTAAITTAGDLRLGFALDEPPPGWHIANPAQVKSFAAAMLRGEPIGLVEEAARAEWLRAGNVKWDVGGDRQVVVTDRARHGDDRTLVFHPPVLALGIGCERSCAPEEVAGLAADALAAAGLAAEAVAVTVSVELKADEPAIHQLARSLGVPARFFPATRLLQETERLTVRSEAAFRVTGCWGVAEGAALAAVGPSGRLVVPRRQSRRATCAIARAMAPIDAAAIGRPRGRLAIVGIGPGKKAWRTPEASALIDGADEIVGYRLYLDLLGRELDGKRRHDSEIGDETARVRQALELAAAGASVALVSSGDAGIYGLATLVFELLDREQRRDWLAVDVTVAPGVSAMQAAAARVGAPLGHDFCAVSLSDLLTPWPIIAARVEAAAKADFAIAFYNPRSARRPDLLAQAVAILLNHRSADTPAATARNLGRRDESLRYLRLAELAKADVDMLSVVLVGSSHTRLIPGNPPRIYTPRGYFDRDRQ